MAVKIADTSEAAAQAQASAWRRMSPPQRVELAVRMSEEARQLTASGIRARHPDYSEVEVQDALRQILLGSELCERLRSHIGRRGQ